MFGSTRCRLRGNDFLEESAQPPTSRFALQLLQLNTLEVERSRNDLKHFLLLVGRCVEVAENEVSRQSPETHTHTHTSLKLFYGALKESMCVMLDGKGNELVDFRAV